MSDEPKTLVELLGELSLGRYSSLDRKSKMEQEERILSEFYANDPLAHAVSLGKTSYLEEIRPIVERYSTVWSRIWAPRSDPGFDFIVERVVESLNSVGAAHSTPYGYSAPLYLAPGLFTTKGRRRMVGENLLELSACGFIGGVSGMIAHLSGVSSELSVALSGALGVSLYVQERKLTSDKTAGYVSMLEETAERTDSFLRLYPAPQRQGLALVR